MDKLIPTPSRLTRRGLLGAAALGATGLSACRVQTRSDSTGGESEGADLARIQIPDPKSELPSADVQYRCMMSGGVKEPYFQAVFQAFHNAHTNIDMQLDATNWERMSEVIPLGIRNNTAPDLFQMPANVPVQTAMKEGWIAALDDIVPDFEDWKSVFPAEAFIPGIHVFEGKTYSWTFGSSSNQYGNLLTFDTLLMEDAGVDPKNDRLTWSSFRETAKTITEKGKGKAYGVMVAGAAMGGVALNLAELAGLPAGGMDYRTGEYVYADPLVKEAIQLLLAVKDDGSMFPGFQSLGGDQILPRFAQGNAGMTFSGSWAVPGLKEADPNYQYGLALPPLPDSKKFHHVGFMEGTAAPLFAYAKSEHPAVTGELLRYMGSVDGQAAFIELTNGGYDSQIPEANKKAAGSKRIRGHAKEARELQDQLLVKLPLPQVVTPDIGQVTLEQKAVTPTFDDTVLGIFTGQVTDIDGALVKYQDAMNKSLDDAIAAARKKGADVSREAWVFRNWDPEKDYTQSDYEGR